MGRSTIALVASLAVLGLPGCGGDPDSSAPEPTTAPNAGTVIAFDIDRRLAPEDSAALDVLSTHTDVPPMNMADHEGMGAEPPAWVGFADAATKDAYDSQMAAAGEAARRYASATAATADGYVLASYFIPQFGVHWVKWSLVKQPFDPAHPAMLLYDGDGDHAHLVGLSYYTWSPGNVPPEGFAGLNDLWHRHQGDCYGGGFVIGEQVMSPDTCAKIGLARAAGFVRRPVGTPEESDDIQRYLDANPDPAPAPTFESNLVAGDELWMLHVWNVAEHPNRLGVFATMNPDLTTCAGACRDLTR